ncbi:alpha-xylosidase [Halomarina halobia]|uniref:Alpha-xylosidase n=1 Tax=Halomarina halobia TaxID=3033386 RepID=A0ABD6AFJ7_9EURY|nr:alpha-xylosidase [Halomarina sp. PSR21]
MQRSAVVAVDEYRWSTDTVTLECITDDEEEAVGWKYREGTDTEVGTGGTVPVSLSFYTPTTFRFEFAANPDAGATETLNEFDEEAIIEPVDLTVEADEGVLRIDTDALRVTVGLDAWSFAVTTSDGRTVFEEQREDIDVHGDLRVDPLGYTTVERNNGPNRVTNTGTAFTLAPDEHVYGFGEKFTGFDKRGQRIESWHVEALGTETERSYKNVPFHLSTRGYGMLVDTTNRVEYDVGNTSTASGTVEVSDDTFSFVFFYGPSFKAIIEEYTALTGRVTRPPKWSFGVWMSRLGYESREHLESITARLREEEIPCDVVHLDPFWMREFHSCDLEWDIDQFPDPESMIAGLHEEGFHLSLWEHPYVPTGTDAFETARENGYFVTDATGKPYVMDNLCQGDYAGAIVDFSNPDAVDWWQEKTRELVEMGVDVFKTDYGEGIPEDAVFANGRTGASMHNYYPFLYNRTVYEAIADVNGSDEALVWGRSAWTGNQRFPMYWGGDAQPSFNGMHSALRGGLSVSLTGFPFWSHDIGGFRGTPSTETYIRWVQFGLLSSHSRCHGTTPREPWAFGEEAVRVFKKFATLRYRLISYLYSYAETACRTGLPVVRPLVLEYTDDPTTYNLDTQYLLGEELLVAPVFRETGDVDVYLPEGEWVDYWSAERYTGGQTLHRTVPLDEIPLFVRAGSILPLHESSQTVQEGSPDEATLRVTPVSTGETRATFDFYDEDRDRVVSLECDIDADGEAIDLSVEDPNATPSFVADVVDIDHPPTTLRVNGEDLRAVDADPARGEWTYDATDRTVRAVL